MDFCRDARFGFEGGAFIALFGDLMPITGMPLGTGALWRVRRTCGPRGNLPPQETVAKLHLWRGLAMTGVVLGTVATAGWLTWQARRDRRGRA